MFLKKSRRGQRGSLLILTSIALPVFLVPLVGLGIDVTICYIVQAELAAAVDGAALGTGRLLSTNANPNDIANQFLMSARAASGAPTISTPRSTCRPAPPRL